MSEPAKAPSSMPSWSVKETWTAAALFLGAMLSRLPFRSQVLYHWDSVNFAFAMQHFDVAAEQPHSPGYIAYVWLCRLVDVLFHDPQTTMVWLSIVGSGLAVVAMYLLGRAMFGRRVGLVAALFLASSPLFWFYGEIALPHTLDLFLVTLSAWLLYKAAQGQGPYLLAAAVSLAVTSGMRQWTPVFLSLLLLVVLISFFQRTGWATGLRWAVPAVVVGGLFCAGWFFPLIASTGGLDRYLQVVSTYSARFTATTSLFMGAGSLGLTRNLRKLGMYTLYGWSVALLPFTVYGLVRLWRRQWTVQWERALFLLAWVFPSLFFYTLIHMGQQGLVFVFLPVLLLVSAQALVRLVEGQERTALTAGMIILVVVNAALFAVLPEYPLGKKHFKVLSWDTLRHNDTYFAERFAAIRQHFPAQSTVIIASRWRHVEWYLPEYVYLPFAIAGKREKDAGSPINTGREEQAWITEELGLSFSPGDTMTVVLFDTELGAFNMNPDLIQSLGLRDGAELEFMILQE